MAVQQWYRNDSEINDSSHRYFTSIFHPSSSSRDWKHEHTPTTSGACVRFGRNRICKLSICYVNSSAFGDSMRVNEHWTVKWEKKNKFIGEFVQHFSHLFVLDCITYFARENFNEFSIFERHSELFRSWQTSLHRGRSENIELDFEKFNKKKFEWIDPANLHHYNFCCQNHTFDSNFKQGMENCWQKQMHFDTTFLQKF